MKLRVAWLRYWFGAVLVGIAAAVLAGLFETMPPNAVSAFEDNNFLGHRLYATAAQLLTTNISRWIPAAVGLALLSAALIRIGGLGRGNLRRFLRFGLPLLILIAMATVYFLLHRYQWLLANIAVKTAAIYCWRLLLNPIGLLLPLALLAWVEWRIIRKRRGKTATPEAVESSSGRSALAFTRLSFAFGLCRRITRFLAIAVIGSLVLLFAVLHLARGFFQWQSNITLPDKPNIIFIMIDTLRVDHLGCYGYDLPTTPNIDKFATTSTRFAHAVAPSSWTVWSVHPLFTSQYPDVLFRSHNKVFERLGLQFETINVSALYGAPLAYPTMAEVLRDRGYSTNAVVSNPWLTALPGNKQGYAFYHDSLTKQERETSPQVTRIALDRLREVKDQRFFMSLVYMDPHDPYYQNPGFTFGDSKHDLRIESVIADSVPRPQLEERRKDLRLYNSEIAYTDRAVGEFLDGLKQLGLYDDALIVFFSDHGEEFREHGGTGHEETLYEEVIRVPLIIKMPGQQAGRVVKGPFPLIDIFPSLMKYLQYPAGHLDLRGDAADLTSILRGSEKPIFCATDSSAKCVISGGRKYIYTEQPEEKREYFDLAADPLERHNLLASEPAAADDLIALFKEWDEHNSLLEVQRVATKSERERLQKLIPDTKEKQELIDILESIGYVGK